MRLASFLIGMTLLVGVLGCKRDPAKVDVHVNEAPEAHKEEEAGHSEDIVLTADAAKIAGIVTQTVQRIPMQAELQVAGVVTNTGTGRAVVTPPVPGRVTSLLVNVGDQVRAGQAVGVLQSPELAQAWGEISEAQREVQAAQATANDANAQVNLARGRLRTAQQTLARQQQLARAGAFSQAPVQQAQQQLNQAEAELANAKAEEIVHQAQVERAERLYAQELISRTELEQARLELEQDKIRQRSANQQIAIAKEAFAREKEISSRRLLVSREVQAAEGDVRAANLELQQSRIRLQSAQAAISGAERGVQNARANYSALSGGRRSSGSSITVIAPIAGVVAHREVTLGQAVERATEICEIENLQTVWIRSNVPEKEISKARKGSTAQVTVSSFPDRIYMGVIQVVGNRLDPKSRTMPVQILVDNGDGSLRADMFAKVSLGVGLSASVLAVPRSAVVAEGDRSVVYVAEEGGKYEEKTVVTGRVKGGMIEIVSGLEAGARVVTKGAFVLKSEKQKAELKGHEH